MSKVTHVTRYHLLASTIPMALLGTVIVACGGSSSAGSAPSSGTPRGSTPSSADAATAGRGGTTVTAVANDFNFKFSTTSVPAGPVRFAPQNQSKTYKYALWSIPKISPSSRR